MITEKDLPRHILGYNWHQPIRRSNSLLGWHFTLTRGPLMSPRDLGFAQNMQMAVRSVRHSIYTCRRGYHFCPNLVDTCGYLSGGYQPSSLRLARCHGWGSWDHEDGVDPLKVATRYRQYLAYLEEDAMWDWFLEARNLLVEMAGGSLDPRNPYTLHKLTCYTGRCLEIRAEFNDRLEAMTLRMMGLTAEQRVPVIRHE